MNVATFVWCHMSTHCYVIKLKVGRYLTMTFLQHVYTYTPPNGPIHVHELAKFEPKDLMEASKCLSYLVTQLFVGKTCATFFKKLLTMK